MLRIQKSRIVGESEEVLDEFTCGICYELFDNPVVTHCCRQIYCSECINEWLTERNTCPNDRQTLGRDELSPAPRLIGNLISKMKVKCDFHKNGCELDIRINELSNHLINCEFNPDHKCKTCGFSNNYKNEHNCMDNLLIRIDSITEENNRLMKECHQLKQELEFRANNQNIFETNENVIHERAHTMAEDDSDDSIVCQMSGKFKAEMIDITNGSIQMAKNKLVIDIIRNGNEFTIKKFNNDIKKCDITFTLGQEFNDITFEGLSVKSVYELKANVLIQSQKYENKSAKHIYVFNKDILTTNSMLDNTTKVRFFKRIQ